MIREYGNSTVTDEVLYLSPQVVASAVVSALGQIALEYKIGFKMYIEYFISRNSDQVIAYKHDLSNCLITVSTVDCWHSEDPQAEAVSWGLQLSGVIVE